MKKSIVLLITLGFLFVAMSVIFRYAGELLVAEDNIDGIENAMIVVLMGSIPDRVLGAVDLYDQGYGDGILMVRSKATGYEELQARNVTIPGGVDINQMILMELGIPEDSVLILPGDAQSTRDEALITSAYFEGRADINSIILVTSKSHSHRAKLIFQRAFRHLNLQVLSAPTPYDSFNHRGWYRNREDFKRVVTEYLKLLHFFVLEQFQIGS